MNGIPRLACSLLLSGMSLAFCGCGEAEKTGDANKTEADPNSTQGEELSTPEQTLAAVKAASKNGNDAKLCHYFTPTAQHDLAAGMVMMGSMMQAMSAKPTKDSKEYDKSLDEKDKKRSEALKALFKKHDLTEKNRPEIHIDLNDSKEKQQAELRKLAGPIKDHCQFFGDFVKVMRQFAETPDARMIEDNAELENLKIDGGHATAEFVQSREGRERRSPIAFEKMDGQWLISEVPNLLN